MEWSVARTSAQTRGHQARNFRDEEKPTCGLGSKALDDVDGGQLVQRITMTEAPLTSDREP